MRTVSTREEAIDAIRALLKLTRTECWGSGEPDQSVWIRAQAASTYLSENPNAATPQEK